MPNGKTIRQIANEIGVTRQAIYKKFKLNSTIADSLKTHSFTVDKVKYYTAEGEKIIKSMFADNSDTSKGTVNLSTEQLTGKLTHDNLTTNPVDRLSDGLTDKLSGSQADKTPIKSAFSANNTFKGTVNLSTKQLTDKLTHDNLTTNPVDRLTDLFSAQLTARDKQIEEKDRQLLEKDRQLAEKDKQIAMLMEQSNNLTQALQAAQALAAADKKQLLLQSGQKNEQPENSDPPENVKKGFFHKIFGK